MRSPGRRTAKGNRGGGPRREDGTSLAPFTVPDAGGFCFPCRALNDPPAAEASPLERLIALIRGSSPVLADEASGFARAARRCDRQRQSLSRCERGMFAIHLRPKALLLGCAWAQNRRPHRGFPLGTAELRSLRPASVSRRPTFALASRFAGLEPCPNPGRASSFPCAAHPLRALKERPSPPTAARRRPRRRGAPLARP